MGAGAGLIRAERRLARPLGDSVLHGPQDGLGVVGILLHVRKGHLRRLGCGAADRAPQERHDLATGADPVRGKHAVRHTVGDALVAGPLHGVVIIAVLTHVAIGRRFLRLLHLRKAGGHLYLTAGHDERILPIALVGQSQLLSVLVHSLHTAHLIPALRRHGHSHRRPLAGTLRADHHRTALTLRRGVHGVVGGMGTAGRGRVAHRHGASVRVSSVLRQYSDRSSAKADGGDFSILLYSSNRFIAGSPGHSFFTRLSRRKHRGQSFGRTDLHGKLLVELYASNNRTTRGADLYILISSFITFRGKFCRVINRVRLVALRVFAGFNDMTRISKSVRSIDGITVLFTLCYQGCRIRNLEFVGAINSTIISLIYGGHVSITLNGYIISSYRSSIELIVTILLSCCNLHILRNGKIV